MHYKSKVKFYVLRVSNSAPSRPSRASKTKTKFKSQKVFDGDIINITKIIINNKRISTSRCNSLYQFQISRHRSDTKTLFDLSGKALSNITLPAGANNQVCNDVNTKFIMFNIFCFHSQNCDKCAIWILSLLAFFQAQELSTNLKKNRPLIQHHHFGADLFGAKSVLFD